MKETVTPTTTKDAITIPATAPVVRPAVVHSISV